MPLIETSVDDLQFGMYVSQLDRPWTETPFMFQGFLLKSDKQLDTLRKYCKHVFVDSEKEDASVAVAAVRGLRTHRRCGAQCTAAHNTTRPGAAAKWRSRRASRS